MLRKNPRPDRPAGIAHVPNRLHPAWKTGTSWGFRDAWTVGIVGPYVLAVWLGDFSGTGHPSFIGISAAAPLFFTIADALEAADRTLKDLQPPFPRNLRRESFCAISGDLPGPHCKHVQKGWYIPGRSPVQTCKVHREIVIDTATGTRVCGPPSGPVTREVYEVWSSDVQKLFAAAGLPRRVLPPPGPGCDRELDDGFSGAPPRITSPATGLTYTVRVAQKEDAVVALRAETDSAADQVFWYVDKALVGKSQGGASLFYRAQPGRFTVRAVDEQGRFDARELRVELVP
jgi:penicillin-binding protein 1C